MDSAQAENKKNNLEDLSKEELIIKYKNLMLIAQKAKLSKDITQKENEKLKDDISRQDNASQEFINKLSEDKLTFVTTVDDLKRKNEALNNQCQVLQTDLASVQEKLSTVETENTTLKHQVTKLIDENEQLLTHLDSLEKHITELNNIGTQQQQQLLELEKLKNTQNTNDDQISELQSMLKVSLEEVEKVKHENNLLSQEKKELINIIFEKENNILTISQELQSKVTNSTHNSENILVLNEKLAELTDLNTHLKEKLKLYHLKIVKFAGSVKVLKEEKSKILECFKLYTDQVKDWKDQLNEAQQKVVSYISKIDDKNINQQTSEFQIAKLKDELNAICKTNEDLENQVQLLTNEKNKLNLVITEKNNIYGKDLEELDNQKSKCEDLIKQLKIKLKFYEDEKKHGQAVEKKLAEKSSEEIISLLHKNEELTCLNLSLESQLKEYQNKHLKLVNSECQSDEKQSESEEQLQTLKQENSELLSEMNHMNQAIKERGETISKLEAHCEEVLKKLQIYEAQANKNIDNISEKEKTIQELTAKIESFDLNKLNHSKDEIVGLKAEIESLKEKLNSYLDSSFAESETMSTSTVSRSEEINRLKDLEGSWEERYGKLRTLALKLKAKIRELTSTIAKEQSEKEEFQQKVSTNVKTIQSLQNQIDKLEDDLEKSKRDSERYLKRLNDVARDISKDKLSLVNQDDVINSLKKQINDLNNEKQQTENWKKQVGAKVQTLRKELEANKVLNKDFELKIAKHSADLEQKEQLLKTEIENHKQTKNLLDQSNNECKKNSVLTLEMQDYERSVKETAKKLEKQQDELAKLKVLVDSQKSTITALREQNKLLEEQAIEKDNTISNSLADANSFRRKISSLEDQLQRSEDKIQTVTQLLEVSRSENEELSTELSKVIAEHQRTNNVLKSERDNLRSQMLGLQQSVREAQDDLSLKMDELKAIREEYDGYKVRAQSVLRQNQSRDVGLEEKLTEEVATLSVQNSNLTEELDEFRKKIKETESISAKLTLEKEENHNKLVAIESEMEELKSQFAELCLKHEKVLEEHGETVRSLKVHANTLSQCYRQQISEQEIRHNREIVELQSRLDKTPSPAESFPVLPTTLREDGEGSESVESMTKTNLNPVPLERLLGSDFDQEISHLKKQLHEQDSKIGYLTGLLSDTEKDLAKHVQMNQLLKDEIRRHQRSVEREEHAENLEYLKNVVFKFVTLNSGDERIRLVPVLNTILKLSPEEAYKLNAVARGETGLKGWTNYLSSWSSPNKPQ